MTIKLECQFDFGERVIIDKDPSLVAVVTTVWFKSHIAECEVSYVHNGDLKTAWIATWRLSKAEAK